VEDLSLYEGREWLEQEHIVGVVKGCVCSFSSCEDRVADICVRLCSFVPYVGYATILMVRTCLNIAVYAREQGSLR
jgi:hypothetical protein